jgi:ABC-type multidrug transport system fused ATPase/permease subunit
MLEDSVDIESAFRPLNALSKILGLAHFSGHRNSFTGKMKHEENRECEFTNVIWCVVVICAVATGFVLNVITLNTSSHFSVFQIVAIILGMPIGYLGTLVAIIAGLTWNRNKFQEFVVKISVFDKYLFGAKRVDVYSKQYRSCIIQLMALPLSMFPFYCYDVYLFGEETNYMEVLLHVTNCIKGVVIVQFINVVWMVKERLEYLNREVASCLELRAEFGSNISVNARTTFISKNESTLQTSRLEAGNKGTGVLVSDFPLFARRRPSFTEVERLLRVRKLYNMLFHVSKLINGMYGIHIISDLIYNFITVVVSVYGVFLVTTGSMKLKPTMSFFLFIVLYMGWIVIALVKVIVISVSCHKASAEVSACYQEVQQLLITDALRQDTRRQLKLLLQQMSSTTALFTACDVFAIDLSVLFTFVSSAATYVVVLVQLK